MYVCVYAYIRFCMHTPVRSPDPAGDKEVVGVGGSTCRSIGPQSDLTSNSQCYHIETASVSHQHRNNTTFHIDIKSVSHRYRNSNTDITSVSQLYHTGITSILHRYHIDITSVSHHRYRIGITTVSHRKHIDITSISHRYHIGITSVSYRYRIEITSISHRLHIDHTDFTFASHRYHIGITIKSFIYHNISVSKQTNITSISHRSAASVSFFLHGTSRETPHGTSHTTIPRNAT